MAGTVRHGLDRRHRVVVGATLVGVSLGFTTLALVVTRALGLDALAPELVAVTLANVAAAAFRFRFASITTGNAQRDRDMNDWQQTVVYPEVVFVLAGVETGADGATVAQGELTFHGTRRPVRFPVSVRADRGTLVIAGEVAVDTRDYGLPVIRKLLILKVDPVVRLRFSLQGRLVAP